MSVISCFKDIKNLLTSKVQPCTGQYVGRNRQGLDVIANIFSQKVSSTFTATAGTVSSVSAPGLGNLARQGDIIRFLSGNLVGDYAFVQSTTGSTTAKFSQELTVAPAVSDTFLLLRPTTGDVVVEDTSGADLGNLLKIGMFDDLGVWTPPTSTNGALKVTIPTTTTVTTNSPITLGLGSITANGQTVDLFLGYGPVEFAVYGTYSNVTLAFEASVDFGTTYFAYQALRADTGVFESSSGALSNTHRMWRLSGDVITNFRIRATTFTSGTMSVRTAILGRVQDPVSGVYAAQSGTWGVNAAVAAPTASTNTITANGQSRSVSLAGAQQMILEYSGTYSSIQLQFEATYDGTNYVSIWGYAKALGVNSSQSGLDTNQRRLWVFNTIGATNFQVRSTAYTSGTMNLRFLPVATGNTVSYTEVINAVSATVGASSFSASDFSIPPAEGVQTAAYDPNNGELHYLEAVNTNPSGSEYGLITRNIPFDTQDVHVVTGTNAIGRVGHDTTGISDGRKTVTTAGTREALAASTSCKWVTITAETDNTGVVAVGGSTVVASLSTRTGTPLFAGDSVTILTDNLADIQLDVTVSGEGVTYTYGT